MADYELYHWGIKGMKWGVRRYQNADGSLTPAGQKRYAAKEARREGRAARREARKAEKARDKLMSTPLRKLSDEQLKERKARLDLEKQALDAEKNLFDASSRKASAGQSFVKKFAKEALEKVGSGVADGGKAIATDWVKRFLAKKFGMDDKDPVKELTDLSNIAKNVKVIENNKTAMPDPDKMDETYKEWLRQYGLL